MSTREVKRTMVAQKAFGFAELFNAMVNKDRLASGAIRFRVEMSAPDGPSTGGGKQALQHVKLIPEGPGSSTIVMGHASQVDAKAELRTFAHLRVIHAQRYNGADLPIVEREYEQLVNKLKGFLTAQGMGVAMVDAPLEPIQTQPPMMPTGSPVQPSAATKSSSTNVLWIVVGVLLVILIGVGVVTMVGGG